ncbi:replicative DNA helicase [candidate division KSB1 bacterium]|nr:replicative DNA helicase [candidate division KSB1 bacterium]
MSADTTKSNQQRVPPQDLDAEMAVLGAMFLESEAVGKAVEHLDESCFYRTVHRTIFQAAVELYENRQPVDVITMADKLQKMGKLEEIGGSYYLIQLAEKVPSAANVEHHARIVLEKSMMRKLINTSTGIITRCYDNQDDVYEMLDTAEKEIFTLSDRRLRKGYNAISPILHETFEKIESFHHKQGGVTGVPSGFAELDKMTSGFQNSDLVIVAGRPSMGKTAFCLSLARNAAVKYRKGIGIVSLEMASYQLAMRMLCAEAHVDSHLVRTGRLPKHMWSNLSTGVGRLADASIHIDDTPAQTILEIRAKARRLKYEHNIDMLIIDYLQLIRGMGRIESRQQEISSISQSLKALAKELDIPVIALSQLSRALESREDKRPQLSDLRESGAIEQDADVVIFIYRPIVYHKNLEDERKNIAEIIIGKQRNGPIGTVELVFVSEYVSFADKAYRSDDDIPGDTGADMPAPF